MQATTVNRLKTVAVMAAALSLLCAHQFLGSQPASAEGEAKYVGADKCKSCHSAASKGEPHVKWAASKHRKAFDTLASEEAKKIAKDKGIADPQKDKACVSCHVTAFDAPDTQKTPKFKASLAQGVQCESCHGPGENHVKARMAADDAGDKVVQVGKGEIISAPPASACKACHNEKSPSFKAFNYVEFVKKIAHPDPRRNHPADYIEKLEGKDK